MILYFDTSALIKRCIKEKGSSKVDELFNSLSQIFISSITKIEYYSTTRRLLLEKVITKRSYNTLKYNIEEDFKYFVTIPFIPEIEQVSLEIIERYQLKTLDSIQLASGMWSKGVFDHFVVADFKLVSAANKEKLKAINPLEE